MKLLSFPLFIFIALLILPAFAQTASGPSQPVLVDIIGPSARTSADPRPGVKRSSPDFPAGAYYSLERSVFDLLNAARLADGLPTLEWDDRIAALARMHSTSMAENSYFNHRDLDGQTVDGRADSFGLSGWRAIGENIAASSGYADPGKTVVGRWLQSAGHRRNILGASWNKTGVGIAAAPNGTLYFTQVFIQR